MEYSVLLYVPNLIGYVRLALLAVAAAVYHQPWLFITLYCLYTALDALDGFLARAFKQTSAFGAWFDVVIDLTGRGMLWTSLSKWGYFIMVIEWLTFVCTHCRGPKWKIPDENFPLICRLVMENGFKNPMGAFAISGIFMLPVWVYVLQSGLALTLGLSDVVQQGVLLLLVVGRILAFFSELFYIHQHIKGLINEETASTLRVKPGA
ncbi:uncharacterized protein LOC127853074 isoform X2 [Dreissena polymorpha]|nr:uncharacterized protein LOC127853074 isoform X2 [Dreissena polymorpha]